MATTSYRQVRSYYAESSADIGIYAKKNGVWTKMTTKTVYCSGFASSTARVTMNWTVDGESFQLGTGVQAVGLTVDGVFGYANPVAVIQRFYEMSYYVTPTSGGVVSATPDGQKTTVTIRPQ